jgi:hypothetical protein
MRLLRKVGPYFGHLLTAVFGTAILSTGFGKLFHPASIIGVIWKEWVLDIVLGGLLGSLAYRISRSKVALWVWVLPSAWFLVRVLSLIPVRQSLSALSVNTGLWYEISGQDCVHRLSDMGCSNFFAFTVPLIRSIGYSLGTLICMFTLRRVTRDSTESKGNGEDRRADS